ncbi:MAG: histidine kinase [Methylotenera sp.]|nr:histidine kinase [Methylotenera sp.]
MTVSIKVPQESLPIFLNENPQLLNELFHAIADEVYLLDASDMKLIYANQSALNNTSCDLHELQAHKLLDVLGVSKTTLRAHLYAHRNDTKFLRLMQDQMPVIGHKGHDQLRVKLIVLAQKTFLLIIKNNFLPISVSDCRECKSNFNQVLMDSESRVEAIISNTPGLVFQLQLDPKGDVVFSYLSDACKALLGLNASDLMQESKLFFAMMNPRDRASLRKRLKLSADELTQLDWEGRVWINDWQDNKWINLRAIPKVLNDGVIQWVGIMINITQSRNEKYELQESRHELARLTVHMNQIKELERTRIAREIHDDLGGNLTAIKISLASIINRLTAGQTVSVEQAKGLESIVDNTFEAIHKISSDLRPNILDLGIVAALEWQAKEFEKQVGVSCTFTTNQSEIMVTPDQAITLFRICQESMSNIAKHANATAVNVELNLHYGEIIMKISDNGVGIDFADTYKPNSFGLRGMQERVAALYGSFDIDKLAEKGTAITVTLPIE